MSLVKSLESAKFAKFQPYYPSGSFIVGTKMARWKQDWTREEVQKLRSLAGTMPLMKIAAELDRTTGSVLAKAMEEKLPVIVHVRSGRA